MQFHDPFKKNLLKNKKNIGAKLLDLRIIKELEAFDPMDLQCELLLFLDSRRYLFDMKRNCETFSEGLNEKTISKFPPLRFILGIDFIDLLDTSAELGMFLIKEPLKWQRYCNEILYACLVTTSEELRHQIQPAQCVVLIRLQNVPNVLINPNNHYCNGLVVYEGVLIATSKPSNYIYHCVWSCPEECEGSEVITHFIPKSTPKCYVCRSSLFENSGMRRCGEQVTATFKLKTDLFGKNFRINDSLISKLQLGSRYFIHAIVSKMLTIVWSVEEVVLLSAPLTTPVPKDISDLHEACNKTPWKFIYCLASTIGVNLSPLNCFMHLKICLLMSLSSIKANSINGSDIVHVLAVGYDTNFVAELMKKAATLAVTSNSLGPCTSVTTSLIASSGGVCVMPLPLYLYNQKQTQSVLAAIESNEITTDTGKAKLKCAVWAHGMDYKKMILHNVASVFGTVTRGDFCQDVDDIVDFILQKSIDPPQTTVEEIQAMKDVTTYIDLVAGINVKLNHNAEELLQSYFLAARKEGPRGVSIGSIKALVALCVASARLCRRNVADIDDAVLAIWLHASGCPEPRFVPEEYLNTPDDIKKLQKIINNFKDWLQQFTGCIILFS